MKKKWIVRIKKTSRYSLEIEEIIKLLLKNRGLKTKKQINEFLNPPDPYTILPNSLGIKKTEIVKAIKRIKKAIAAKENIIIYGDYDADGICATAILWETLHILGAKVMPFIPHREKHGYGLNKKGINDIISNPPRGKAGQPLIITVDNGITAYDGVEFARKKGIDVIITDHHAKRGNSHAQRDQHQKKSKSSRKDAGKTKYDLPKANSIIHSTKISGTGVSWFFAKEIYKSFHKNLKGFKGSSSLELAAIGTITDMMPMLNTNRSLVRFGLEELRKSQRFGIKSLCSQAGIDQDQMDTYHLGFIVGPRLNAMGRLEDAIDSLRLLCTKNNKRADSLASKLDTINRQRQELTRTIFEHARLQAKDQKSKIIYISHKSYNQGVVGLVAGRLADEFNRPAIIISKDKEYSKGSVRSIKGFNIIKVLRRFEEFFVDLGGHPMAAGFTIKTKRIKDLREKLEKFAEKEIKDKLLQPVINIDLEINFSNINWTLFKEIEKFSPFGIDNRRPVFVSKNIEVVNVRAVGREGKHLKLKVRAREQAGKSQKNNETILDCIAFNFGNLSKKMSNGDLIDICYSIEKNVWNGRQTLNLKIDDIKLVKRNSKI